MDRSLESLLIVIDARNDHFGAFGYNVINRNSEFVQKVNIFFLEYKLILLKVIVFRVQLLALIKNAMENQ